MNFLSNFLSKINNFFLDYNYNTFWWYLTDNYMPKSLSNFINFYLFDYFNFFLEKSVLLVVSINSIVYNVLISSEALINLGFTTNMINALFISFKFLLCISLLIFARGGIPRFRFDYLTKLGWIRFLSLVLLSLLIELLLLSMF